MTERQMDIYMACRHLGVKAMQHNQRRLSCHAAIHDHLLPLHLAADCLLLSLGSKHVFKSLQSHR